MIQFYCSDIEENPMLGDSESGHCVRVLRKHEGDEIRIVDGKGNIYLCEITDAHPRHTMVRILERRVDAPRADYTVSIALAPTKSIDRMEWLLEKLVEIGVDKIYLLRCDRSERKVVKHERLEKIVVSAMNQSLKSRLPMLCEMTDFNAFLNSQLEGFLYMGYCDENTPRKEFEKEYFRQGGNVTILIGPEGDFSPREVAAAIERGFIPVTFGNNRLRTETAALYAVEAVQVIEKIRNI